MAGKKIPSIVKSIQKYKLPELNYAYQKSISYSQLSTFTNCPKQWELKYRDGNYLFDASINSIFGTSMHNTIQKYITVMYTQSTVVADQLDLEEDFAENFRTEYRTTYEKNNNIHFSNSEEMREYFDDGIEILDENEMTAKCMIHYENTKQFTAKRIADLEPIVNPLELQCMSFFPMELVEFDEENRNKIKDFYQHSIMLRKIELPF
jgi:hypothetical protein